MAVELRSSRKKVYKEDEMFIEGTRVEVCGVDEDFKGAWYVATILKIKSPSPSSRTSKFPKGKALVEYDTLLRYDGKPLTETVDVSSIRPLPPPASTRKLPSFDINDVVDAYHKKGWWKGVVIKVRVSVDYMCKLYTVIVFENPPAKVEFGADSLRFHLDWVNDSWFRPKKQERMEGLIFTERMAVEVKLDEENPNDDWWPATVLQRVGYNSFLVEYNSSSSKDGSCPVRVTVDSFCMRPSPPKSEVKKFEFFDKVNAFYESAWRYGFVTNILSEEKYIVSLKDTKHGKRDKEFSCSELRPLMTFKNGKWFSASKDKNNPSSQELLGHANNNLRGSKVAIQHQRSSATENYIAGKTPFTNSDKNSMQHSTPPDNVPTLSPPSKKFKRESSAEPLSSQTSLGTSMLSKKARQNAEGGTRTVTHCSNHNVVQNEPSSRNDSYSWIKNASTLTHNDGKSPDAANQLECSRAAKGHTIERTSCTDLEKNPIQQLTGYSAIYSYIKCFQTEYKKAKKHKEINQKENGVEDAMMISTEEPELQPNVKSQLSVTTSEPMKTADHDEIMISLEELGMVVANYEVVEPLVEKAGSLVRSAMATSSNYLGKEVVAPVAEIACSLCNDSQPRSLIFQGSSLGRVEEKQVMPFEKDSSLWKIFESQKIFQRMPQDPHFCPLAECNEVEREATAIGKMACFAILAEKIPKLKVDAACVVFDGYSEALADLERHGFDVKAVVDRLNNLLSIKERKTQHKNQSRAIQGQMADCTPKKNKAQEDVDASDMKIRELLSTEREFSEKVKKLEEQLCHFNRKRLEAKEQVVQAKAKQASDMLMKEKMKTEMAELQENYNDLMEAISNDDLDFETVARAPW